jgi:hypothetical protein
VFFEEEIERRWPGSLRLFAPSETTAAMSLAEWAQSAQVSPKQVGARRRARSAADLVLEHRAQRSAGA